MCGFFRDNTIVYCFYTLTDGIFAIFGLPVNNLVIQLGEKTLVNFWPGPRQPPPFTPRTIIPPRAACCIKQQRSSPNSTLLT